MTALTWKFLLFLALTTLVEGKNKQRSNRLRGQNTVRELDEVFFSNEDNALSGGGIQVVDDDDYDHYDDDNFTIPENFESLVGQPVYFESQMDDPALSQIQARIVGGSDSAQQRNFCMHLKWDSTNSQYVFGGCGGSLVSNCHVLSAAHCSADSREGLPDGVYCNAYNPFAGNYGYTYHFSKLKSINIHPGFDNTDNENDVAVLEMKNCISDMSNFPVMKVADQDFLDDLDAGDSLVVSGFGRLSETSTSQVHNLQKVEVPYIPTDSCDAYYPGQVYDDMICAGQASGGIDACQGDSGGPLFHQGSNSDTDLTQVGIVSWGTGCARRNYPGVYSSVAYHHSWIKDEVCGNSRTDTGALELCGSSSSSTSGSTPPPTTSPTAPPTVAPTKAPTKKPTNAPTASPTQHPTSAPTSSPTSSPTSAPTVSPTASPTASPTTSPTASPTSSPTSSPSSAPSIFPTFSPSDTPTSLPTEPTCAAIHQVCSDEFPCCGSYECKVRVRGSNPICSVAATTEGRTNLADGRGGAGGAAKNSGA